MVLGDIFVWWTYINMKPRNQLKKFQGHMTSFSDVIAISACFSTFFKNLTLKILDFG